MNYLMLESWNPYVIGIGIGIISWLAFLLIDRPIGCSTAFARTAGIIEKVFRPHKTHEREYYKKFEPVIDWEWMFVVGIIIGGFFSSVLSGTFRLHVLSSTWISQFGQTPFLRIFAALIGGVILGFGARWAGGCTSGHGISGTLQMAVSGWLAVISFFITGIFTAFILY